MNTPDAAAVDRMTILSGLGPVQEVSPQTGGANNRVYLVEAERGRALLKAYYRHPDDPRDRLGSEFAFARYAWSAGIRSIPQPLVCDPNAGLGLFEYIDGQHPVEATESLVEQAIEFVRDLNASRWRPAAARLPIASEACFSIEEHLGIVGGRANRLGEMSPGSDIDREAFHFVHRELLPMWDAVRNGARAAARLAGISLDRPLDSAARCVSPSDFGFHNALLAADGRVAFLDFEYAGWDDPAKLICDFFSQPAVPVPEHVFDTFASAIASCFHDPHRVIARAQLLMMVYRVKWVCILLNEFLPVAGSRRRFSAGEPIEDRKRRQLDRARALLASMHDCERMSA
jgi:hypothetical protein